MEDKVRRRRCMDSQTWRIRKLNTAIGVAKINESMSVKDSGTIEFENCKLKEVISKYKSSIC